MGLDETGMTAYNYYVILCAYGKKRTVLHMQELDIKLVLGALLARLKWIIVSVAVGVLLFASYAYFLVPEEYTSSAKLYVRNMATDTQANSATAGNLSAAEYLANTYAVVMKSEPVLTRALDELDGAVTMSELKGMISSSLIKETALLQVSAKHSDPLVAQRVCSTMAGVLADTFSDVTGEVSSARVVEDAVPAWQTEPKVLRSALLGAVIGLAISVVVILLKEFLNNTVRDKESLQQLLNVPVLGEIPSFTQEGKGDKRYA